MSADPCATAAHRVTPREAMQMARYGEPTDTYSWDPQPEARVTEGIASKDSSSRVTGSRENARSSTDVDLDDVADATVTAHMKPLVYVAGPYTHPDPVLNTREACLVADRLAEMGAAVVVPHLSLFWHAISPAPLETWYQRDLGVLRHCHAVVRLPGKSMGADNEVEEAASLDIPIFTWPVAERHLGMFIGKWRP